MSERYLSGADLGRLVGVSRQAVSDARRKGIIKTGPDGLFDILDQDVEQWLKKLPFQRRASAHKKDREALTPSASEVLAKAAEDPPATAGARALVGDTRASALQDGELDPNARNRSARGSTRSDPSYAESERKLKAAQADFWDTRAKERRGEFISRAMVETFISKLWAIDTAQFLTRADRIGASLAAMARSAASDDEATIEINDALTQDAYQEQRAKKREMNDFLKSIKSSRSIEPEGPSERWMIEPLDDDDPSIAEDDEEASYDEI
jgi:hypothetical protein